MRHEVMVCTVCGHPWLVRRSWLALSSAIWCEHCGEATGRIAEATRPHDTQPGPAAALFETVMLARLAGLPLYASEQRLRRELGLESVAEQGRDA